VRDLRTLRLIETLVLPESHGKVVPVLNEDQLVDIFPLALKNKIPLLYLEHAVGLCDTSKKLKNLYSYYLSRSSSALKLITDIDRILTRNHITYAIFKTIQPFPFTKTDVDIIFFSKEDLIGAYRILRTQGYELAGSGYFSITMYSPENKMNIDLQSEIAVSRFVYIKNNLLKNHVTQIDVNEITIQVLEPLAEVSIVFAHSIFKEQIFTLSDYYSTFMQLSSMTENEYAGLLDFAEKAKLEFSLKIGLLMVNTISAIAHSKKPNSIIETANKIKVGRIEKGAIDLVINQLVGELKLPYKYHPLAFVAALSSKVTRDPFARSTLGQQFADMTHNIDYILENAILHAKRGTY
jgi:hypothetical protein